MDKAIRTLVLTMLKMSGYVKTFKVKHGDQNKNNSLMSFCIGDEKGLEKSKAIWLNIEDLPVYDDRYIKTKRRTYGDKNYANFRCFNVPEVDTECKSFTATFIDSLLAYKSKYYVQVYLENFSYKIQNNQYLDENLFEG